jgi:hypothetical protein
VFAQDSADDTRQSLRRMIHLRCSRSPRRLR